MMATSLVVLCMLAAAPEAVPTRVAVLQVSAEGGAAPVVAGQLTHRLAEVLAARPGFEVIAPDDIRAMLEREATLQMLGCDDDSCLAEIGGALGADILVKGRVAKLEEVYAVSLSAVDPGRARPLGRASETWGGPSIGLIDLIDVMVERLLPTEDAPPMGASEVTGAEPGSQIFVDDEVRGTAPAGQMGSVEAGAHEVKVIAEGFRPVAAWVVVRTGKTTTVPVRQEALDDRPFYATWWFWTLTGAAVVGAAAGTAVALSSGGDGAGAATGVNVSVNADTAFTEGR